MSKITAITLQEKNKKRCNLFVDGEFFAGISVETALKNRLKVDLEIDQKSLKEILDEDERAYALAKAFDYVSKAIKTKRQVKDYLLRKGFSEDAVWFCIDKLKEYSYIDDCEYSKRYIESVSKTQGKRLVEYKLMSKGVRKEDISCAFEQTEIDSKENAKALAVKHLKNKEITKENIAKTYRYLIGRGFSYDDVDYAMSSLKSED
ncbi:MAG: hypothetical protein E7347_03080 [Clostridiales bacterium]|nr:hypothetical protein [Clostridiales bacterium]